MPASPTALAGAGLGVDEPGFQNSTALAEPRLAFLGDVFSLPASWPLTTAPGPSFDSSYRGIFPPRLMATLNHLNHSPADCRWYSLALYVRERITGPR
jgi:hypothetical protein